MNYEEIIADLEREVLSPATAKKAARAIRELRDMHQMDRAEIIQLRRWIGAMEGGE